MVERNMGNAVKRGTVVPPRSRATRQCAGSGVLFFGIDRDDRGFGQLNSATKRSACSLVSQRRLVPTS
jgi:hypothetical protein